MREARSQTQMNNKGEIYMAIQSYDPTTWVDHVQGNQYTILDAGQQKTIEIINRTSPIDVQGTPICADSLNKIENQLVNLTENALNSGGSSGDPPSTIPPMLVPREQFVVGQYNNLIIAAGGYNNGVALNSAELYDTSTGIHTILPNMNVPHAAAVSCMYGSRFYVFSGYETAVCEYYDLANGTTGTWTTVSPYPFWGYIVNTTCNVIGNTAYLTCGRAADGIKSFIAAYNMATGTWSEVPNMLSWIWVNNHQTNVIDNGLLITGGDSQNGATQPTQTCSYYDLTTSSITGYGDLLTARTRFPSVVVARKVYFMGGQISDTTATAACEYFDFDTKTHVALPPLNYARYNHTAVVIDNTIRVSGGVNSNGDYVPWDEYFDLSKSDATWGAVAAIPRQLHQSLTLGHTFIDMGGRNNTGTISTCSIPGNADTLDGKHAADFAAANHQHSGISPLLIPREQFATGQYNNLIITAGGYNNGVALKSAELYDTSTGARTMLPDMNAAHAGCHGYVYNGKFYIFSGSTAVCEYYDLNQGIVGVWVKITSVSYPVVRYGFSGYGQYIALFAGRRTDNGSYLYTSYLKDLSDDASAWISFTGTYNESFIMYPDGAYHIQFGGIGNNNNAMNVCKGMPIGAKTGSSTTFGSLITPRGRHASAVKERTIYLTGGCSSIAPTTAAPIGALAECESYNMDSHAHASLPPLNYARCQHTAIVIGSMLRVSGGIDPLGNLVPWDEYLDISNSSAQWVAIPAEPRQLHQSLTFGDVVIDMGGRNGTGTIASCAVETDIVGGRRAGEYWCNSNAPASTSTDGYQKLPSGLILQWGNVTCATANMEVTVTLPIAATTVLQVLTGTQTANTNVSYRVISGTKIGITASAAGAVVSWYVICK